MKKIITVFLMLFTLSIIGQNQVIRSYSPMLVLRRSTDVGGFIQGIQTELSDESSNFYFGNIGINEWVVSKGKYNGSRLLTVKSNGNVGIGTTEPTQKLEVRGSIKVGSGDWGALIIDGKAKNDWMLNANNDGERFLIRTQKNDSKEWSNTYLSIKRSNGNVGIGTSDTKGYKLAIAGKAVAEEVIVKLKSNWPDYVFSKNYNLPSLEEVEKHIKEKGHLKNIPTAKEVKKNGVQLGEMNKKLLQKIEELTLYTIQQEKRINKIEKENLQLKQDNEKIKKLESKIDALLKKIN